MERGADPALTRREAEAIADQAAHKAVHETFRLFGVDTDSQQSVNEFRADLVHARKIRRLWDGAGGRVFGGLLLAFLIGGIVMASDWLKFVFSIKG